MYGRRGAVRPSWAMVCPSMDSAVAILPATVRVRFGAGRVDAGPRRIRVSEGAARAPRRPRHSGDRVDQRGPEGVDLLRLRAFAQGLVLKSQGVRVLVDEVERANLSRR